MLEFAMKGLFLRAERLSFKVLIILIFLFFRSYGETIIEPKIIEYKGVKEEQIKQINKDINNLYLKQKQLEEKINSIVGSKNLPQTDRKVLEYLLTELEAIKQNQESLKQQISKLNDDVKGFFLMQNLIQLLIFIIFIVFMIILYKYKKDTGRDIEKVKEKVEKLHDIENTDIIISLTEKAKTDPNAAKILQTYLKSRGEDNEV